MPVLVAHDIQYFVMGTWFPLGIALFHAANLRLLHVAELQKRFTDPALTRKGGYNGANSSWLCKMRSLKYDTKVLVFISVGMVIQVCSLTGVVAGLANIPRHFSPYACGWFAESTILLLVSVAPRSVETPSQSSSRISALDGSGGLVSFGNSYGLGVLLLR